MPNHYTTIAICSGNYEFDCDEFNERHKETNLCAVVKPMPEVVEQVPARRYPDGTTEKERRSEAIDPKTEADKSEAKFTLWSKHLADWYDQWEAGEKPTIDWLQWAEDNWGTKWGTYDLHAYPLGGDHAPVAIKFQSAWSPPSILREIGEWLIRVGKFDKVQFVGFDPYDASLQILEV